MGTDVKLSSKYQMVIPKQIRKELDLHSGQTLRLKRAGKKIVIDTESVVDKYAGSLRGAWGDEDPVKVIRQLRNEDRD